MNAGESAEQVMQELTHEEQETLSGLDEFDFDDI